MMNKNRAICEEFRRHVVNRGGHHWILKSSGLILCFAAQELRSCQNYPCPQVVDEREASH
jgi:hypothetical protein